MKRIVKLTALLVTVLFVLASCAYENKVQLFNGKDLSNWETVLLDSTANPEDVFMVKELTPGYLDGAKGTIWYHAVFGSV